MTTLSPSAPTDSGRAALRSIAMAGAAAAVAAIVAATVVMLLAKALGAPGDFHQFSPAMYVPLVAIGVVAGAAGWHLVGRRVADPRRTMARLVPSVLALSLVPDVLLGVGGSAWSGVVTLMCMHLAVAAAALPIYVRLLPLPVSR